MTNQKCCGTCKWWAKKTQFCLVAGHDAIIFPDDPVEIWPKNHGKDCCSWEKKEDKQ